jgi:hypothetical protein
LEKDKVGIAFLRVGIREASSLLAKREFPKANACCL